MSIKSLRPRVPACALACALALGLAACKREPAPADAPAEPAPETTGAAEPAPAPATPEGAPAPAAPANAENATKAETATDAAASAAKPGFDLSRLPVSEQPLGAFPYFGLPAGYKHRDAETKDFARFPFWVGADAPVWVEGKFYQSRIDEDEGKSYSMYEVRRNFEIQVQQLGGQKVWEGKIQDEEIESWGDEISMGFIHGLGDIYNNPALTYVVRRNDGNIWLHLLLDTKGANYIVGKEEGFAATAQMVPASALKQQIEASGKVALQVNFATDKTDILPESQPQIAQVVQLLKEDPALQLAINGHTDNTGDKQHNQALSEGRAKAVVAALVAQGVEAGRLQSAGFGDSQPVADNASEEGKAKNRRVELVKR